MALKNYIFFTYSNEVHIIVGQFENKLSNILIDSLIQKYTIMTPMIYTSL